MKWWNALPIPLRRAIWAEAQLRMMANSGTPNSWPSICVPMDDSGLQWPMDELTQARLSHVYVQMQEHFQR